MEVMIVVVIEDGTTIHKTKIRHVELFRQLSFLISTEPSSISKSTIFQPNVTRDSSFITP